MDLRKLGIPQNVSQTFQKLQENLKNQKLSPTAEAQQTSSVQFPQTAQAPTNVNPFSGPQGVGSNPFEGIKGNLLQPQNVDFLPKIGANVGNVYEQQAQAAITNKRLNVVA